MGVLPYYAGTEHASFKTTLLFVDSFIFVLDVAIVIFILFVFVTMQFEILHLGRQSAIA